MASETSNEGLSKRPTPPDEFRVFSTTEASPRRADARPGCAHPRNDRRCRNIEAVNATKYCQGVQKTKSRFERREREQ